MLDVERERRGATTECPPRQGNLPGDLLMSGLAELNVSISDLLIGKPGLAGNAHAELPHFTTTNRTIDVRTHRNLSLDFARPIIGGA